MKFKPLFDIWRHISDLRGSGHKLAWTLETRSCLLGASWNLLESPGAVSWEPGTPALSVLSESEFVVRVRESEIVVLVAEGSVTDAAEHMSLVFVLLAVI